MLCQGLGAHSCSLLMQFELVLLIMGVGVVVVQVPQLHPFMYFVWVVVVYLWM